MTSWQSFMHGIFWDRKFHSLVMQVCDDTNIVRSWNPQVDHDPVTSWELSLPWLLDDRIRLWDITIYPIRIRWEAYYKQISKFAHRSRFSRPSWLHWWILPSSKGDNNTIPLQFFQKIEKEGYCPTHFMRTLHWYKNQTKTLWENSQAQYLSQTSPVVTSI